MNHYFSLIYACMNLHCLFTKSTTQRGGINATRDCNLGCLYNVVDDPNEHTDLADSNPAKLKVTMTMMMILMMMMLTMMMITIQELQDALTAANNQNFSPNRGAEDPKACELAESKYGGFVGPFVFP